MLLGTSATLVVTGALLVVTRMLLGFFSVHSNVSDNLKVFVAKRFP